MVIMSRSQDKLQKVADEISELAVSSCIFVFSPFLPHDPVTSLTPLSPLSHSPHSLPPEEKHNREVCIIPVDFSDGQEIYPRIAEELQDLDIGVLGKANNTFLKPLSLLCSWTHPTCLCF